MANSVLDNGTLVTLGLVGIVAAVGAANKAGLYGSRARQDGARDFYVGQNVFYNGQPAVIVATGLPGGTYGDRVEVAVGDAKIVTNAHFDHQLTTSKGQKLPKFSELMYPPKTSGSRASSSFAAHPFGWAQVQGGHVVKVSDAERKPTGTGWGAVASSGTQIGDVAYLDGGDVYLSHRMGKDSEEGSMAHTDTHGSRASGSYYAATDGDTAYGVGTTAAAALRDARQWYEGNVGALSVDRISHARYLAIKAGNPKASGTRRNGTIKMSSPRTYAVAIEDQPDGWDVSAKSLKEAVTEAVKHVLANEADPVGTRFHIRRSDQSYHEKQTYEVTDSGHARRLGMGSMARKNSTRRDVLQEDARKSGYLVETYSPGDGTTRYKFFSLAEMARKGVSEREQSYFGPLDGVHTALGLAAAKKWLARAPSTHSSSEGSMAMGASPRFAALVRGKLPGALLDTEDMSVSTLRQYERNGWIRRSGANDPRSWAYVTLTRDGYSAGLGTSTHGSMDRVNKYEYLIVLQGYFRPGGWEDLFTVEKKGSGFDLDANREIKARLKEYRENDPRAYRLINRKTLRS